MGLVGEKQLAAKFMAGQGSTPPPSPSRPRKEASASPKEIIMEQTTPTNYRRRSPPDDSARAGKLMIKGVITHDKLIAWVKERNPSIARARKDERRR